MSRRFFCKVLLVAVAVFGLLVLSGVLLAQGRSEDAFERVREVQERHTRRLMAKEGVEGTAIGYNQNDQLAVKVFTAGPGVRGIPQELDGVPVQVVVTGKFYALSATGRFDRPVPIGVSTGHPDITAGTIGCRVTDGTNVYALSNNHVYANENRASIADNVLQPGAYDGGVDPGDAIGTLYEFEPILFGMFGVNIIDAAIALCSTDTLDNKTPEGGYGTPNHLTAPATVGLGVQKYGRTTSLTKGEVTAVNGIFLVRYSRSFAMFFGQIVIEPGDFSAGGDSGSLIVTDDLACKPVGLLFAGSDTMTIANPIDLVLLRFGVTIDDSDEGPVNNPPVANFSGSPTSGDAPLQVNFTDLSSENPTSWSWNFGEGGSSTDQNPSYTYHTPGTYTVTLTATNADGSDSETKTDYINVTEPAPPVADFVGSPTSGDAPLQVNFTDLSSGNPTSWSWNFGDGVGTSTVQDPLYTYNTVGTYTVTLTATNADGSDSKTKTNYINVTEPGEVTVMAIAPDTMVSGTTEDVTITGSGFEAGANVTFENGSGPTPKVSNVVVVNATTITATVTAKKGGPRRNRVWDVRVTNPDSSTDVLVGWFTVTP